MLADISEGVSLEKAVSSIKEKYEETKPSPLQRVVDSKHFDWDIEKYAAMHEVASLASMANKIKQQDFLYIKSCLGGSLDKYNNQPFEVKLSFNLLLYALLQLKIDGKF